MNKNKGIISIGLILAIVLGVIVVGGGAYYLGKINSLPPPPSKNIGGDPVRPQDLNWNDQSQENQNQNVPAVDNQQTGCTSSSTPSITVLSPNGGEVYKAGEKITVKWKSCNVTSPMINFSLMEHDSSLPYKPNVMDIKDKAWISLNSFDSYTGTPNDGIEQLTLPKNSDPSFNPGQNYFINVYGENKNSQGARIFDYSDNLFTIYSAVNSEESSVEVFKHQPGAIKSIEYDGAELLVDLLTNNPNWIPGGNEGFFLNQNLKIRRLYVNNATIIKNCRSQSPDYYSGFENNLLSFTTYVQDKINKAKTDPGLVGHFGYTAYFDINGTNITTIYEQCLP